MTSVGEEKATNASQWVESEHRAGVYSHMEKKPDLEHALKHSEDAKSISPEHREYLIQRHGTVELDPLPGHDDKDPLNWPRWKVRQPQRTACVCCID